MLSVNLHLDLKIRQTVDLQHCYIHGIRTFWPSRIVEFGPGTDDAGQRGRCSTRP